jgi:hypothetical protein
MNKRSKASTDGILPVYIVEYKTNILVSGTHNYAGKLCDLAGRKLNSTQIAALM